MDSDKLDRRLLERLAGLKEAELDRPIPVVIQCLGTSSEEPDTEGSTDPEESTKLAFLRLYERLAELGASGDVREVPVSNALEARLTPSQINALATHPAVGRIILSRQAAEVSDKAPASASALRRQEFKTRGPEEMISAISRTIVGQGSAIRAIVPYIMMYEAGLAPGGRPVGVFLLLGPTGTGKTRTVEALAETLHGSDQQLLRIDCSEFQEDHEIAKLIGAPPGYIGHRDTAPFLTAQRLVGVTSPGCDLSIVLFDEIEKAAPSLTRLLLGVLDRAVLRLGDGGRVNFERSLIFMTSNLGAHEMTKELAPSVGFAPVRAVPAETSARLDAIALAAVRRAFSPEFVNRIDAVVTYQPLDDSALRAILAQQIDQLQQHVNVRLGPSAFLVDVPEESRLLLLRRGASAAYGARELRRTIHRHLTQPLAALVAAGKVAPGSRVHVVPATDGDTLAIDVEPPTSAPTGSKAILVVDDNRPLLELVRDLLSRAGWQVTAVETAAAALADTGHWPFVAFVDDLLPDESGLDLAMELKRRHPETRIVVMSGIGLPAEDEAVCQQAGFSILPKPFQATELLAIVQRASAPTAAGAA